MILFFPLSEDPLRKIPAVRLALWPVTRSERVALRFAGRWRFSMSPSFSGGLMQMLLMIFPACATGLWNPVALAPVTVVYAWTLRQYGRRVEAL